MKIRNRIMVSMAIWLVFAAFVVVPAKALPNHVVAGGILGPGNDVSPGPANPANAADMVFYSTNQPSYTLIVGPDSFTDADGTDPALYARDVGNIWDWADGDEMVTVFETRRGVGGWTGVNHTTSLFANLQMGSPVQDVGDSTLEPFPVITVAKGSDWVNLTWSPMIDAGNNLQSYQIYTAPTMAGPFVSLGTTPHAPGMRSYNDTGLSVGSVCYQLSANYKRDNIGGLYETTGRSETVCAVITGTAPFVVSTSPTYDAINVPLTEPVVITFSEPMNTGTVTYPLDPPDVVFTPAWSGGDTILTLTHATDFVSCQLYYVNISGMDLDSNDLVPTPTVLRFTAVCDLPSIVTTDPPDGAIGVPLTQDIVVTFSEAMNTATVSCTPDPPGITLTPAWSGGDTILTLSHATPFAASTLYTVTCTGQDLDGNGLVAGAVPNPWTFTTNNPPTATIDPSDTLIGSCCNGGSDLPIPWTMDDAETPLDQLVVWLNYTYGATTDTIAGPLTGRTSPDSYVWTAPTLNEPITIWLEVIDGVGASAQDSSASVIIDSTAPTVQSVNPPNGETDVPTDSQLIITFSEPMQKSTVVVSFAPSVSSVQLAWDATNTTATVTHALFQVSTQYTMTVNATAKDACTPGNEMGTDYTTNFTTGSGPKLPGPPTNLAVSSTTIESVVLTWSAPTQYTDGSALPASDIALYRVYRAESPTGAKISIGEPTGTTFTDSDVEPEATYYYWVTAVNTTNIESDYSNQASATIPKETTKEEFPWIWIIVVIIVILVILGLVLLLRRKKPEEEPPEPIEEEEELLEPTEVEEETPESEVELEEAPPEEVPSEETPENFPEEEPGMQ